MPKESGIIRPTFKPLRLVRDDGAPAPSALRATTKGRLDNQLARAFRQSFGAEEGLRVIVRIATLEMLRAGASRGEIHATLGEVVTSHPACAESKASLVSGQTRATALKALIVQWSDRTHDVGAPRS